MDIYDPEKPRLKAGFPSIEQAADLHSCAVARWVVGRVRAAKLLQNWDLKPN